MTFEDTAEIAELRQRVREIISSELSPEFLRRFVADADWQGEATAFCNGAPVSTY